MSNDSATTSQLFSLLEGIWTGEGRGGFPTVTSFDYRETLTFTQRDEKTLAHAQRTQKRYDGNTEWLPSHWESGFIRSLDNGDLEMTCAQMGRTEVLIGSLDSVSGILRIYFASKIITNDPRMVSSARTFELVGDTLRYEMEMQTTAVNQLTKHLAITLRRVEQSDS
jgi:hypothetical protein